MFSSRYFAALLVFVATVFAVGRDAAGDIAGPAVSEFHQVDSEVVASRRFGLTGLDVTVRDGAVRFREWSGIGTGRAGQFLRAARFGHPIDSGHNFAIRTAPGGSVAFRLDADAETVEPVMVGDAGLIYPEVMTAVDSAPIWIRGKLLANLAGIPLEVQSRLVGPLRDDSLSSWHDEIAFLLATIPAATLSAQGFDVRAVVDQARFAQVADEFLDYVEIRDYEDPVYGHHSTAAYKWAQGGVEKDFELPFMDYYWWVLHPVLDMEEFEDTNPLTGLPDQYPAGLTWRQYYLHDRPWPPADGEIEPASYVPHFIFKEAPSREWLRDYSEIGPDSLSGWNPVQRGYIREIDVGAMHLTVDAADRPTTIEFKVRRTGIVLATTLEVEKAWAEGRSDLLENMLRYGPGNAGCSRLYGRLLVIREREPVESSPGVVEAVLDEWNYDYDVVDSAWLAEGDLSNYVKIIVPSDQPLEVYQAVSDNSVKLLEWLRGKWRILEIHGAVSDPSRDWSGIVMPGGFTVDGLTIQATANDDFARVLGQPFLNPATPGNPDLPATLDLLWDDSVRDIRGGDRFVSDTACAIDRVTWWAGQNMWDSVSDWAEKHPGAVIGRTSQANRVLYQHYGNCGELQDIQTAAFRTMLIPSANTSNGAEDHVWSEFLTYMDMGTDARPIAQWHPSALDWSDGYVNIDNPNVSMSKKFGGGKNISFVTSYRGDGALLNRTAYYADTGFLTVKVRDKAGTPVAGATVLVATESWALEGDAYPLTLAFWDVTDDTGEVVIETGANIQSDLEVDCQILGNRCNNYYIRVLSDIGTFPSESGVALAVSAAEASVGYAREVTAIIDGALEAVDPGTGGATWTDLQGSTFSIRLDSATALRCGALGEGYSWCNVVDDPQAAVPSGRMMILDEAEWQRWLAGETFDAAGETPFFAGGEGPVATMDAGWPSEGVWYVVVEHVGPLQNRMLLTGSLEYATGPLVAEVLPEAVEGGRDACCGDTVQDSAPSELAFADGSGDADTADESEGGGCCSVSYHGSAGGGMLPLVLMCVVIVGLGFVWNRSACKRSACDRSMPRR